MFENCTTLSQLNQERVSLVSVGVPLVQVNNAYNEAKKKLTASTLYTKVTNSKIEVPDYGPLYASLLYKGASPKPGAIMVTKEGVYV